MTHLDHHYSEKRDREIVQAVGAVGARGQLLNLVDLMYNNGHNIYFKIKDYI